MESIKLYNTRKEGIEQVTIKEKKEATKEIILNLLKYDMNLEKIAGKKDLK